jgi:acetylxylan esterase
MNITKRVTLALVAVAGMIAGWLVAASPAHAASLTQVTNFGSNPTNLGFFLYVPDNIPAGTRPAVLVAVHYCTGSGPAFFSGTQFASLADQFKFIVIYPSATRSSKCFDVSTAGALSHNGNSDPVGIISMVNWVVANRNGDRNRVFVTGASSGGMMTNVLLGDYPDVFKAGAAFMGVPFFCFRTDDPSMWNNACANGQTTMTAQQWGDRVRAAFPGFSGARPRMQLWHGTTDTTLNFHNFGEEIKQWTNVLGVSQTPVSTDTPQSGWTRTRYGTNSATAPVEAISVSGVGHSLPLNGQAAMAIHFFGLDGSTPPSSPPPSSPPPSGGSCTATMVAGTVFGDRYNTTVNVSGTNTWIVTVTITPPQRISTTWNTSPTWDSSGNVMTARPNGNGNSFGFTTMFNGNSTARPTVSCRVG